MIVFKIQSERDIEAAFAAVPRESSALIMNPTGSLTARGGLIIALAARYGLPVFYNQRDFAKLGGLISYGTSFIAEYHQIGVYAARILKGANPADLPVIQPTKFELVINLNAAKALGLTVPPNVLAIADEVIE